jgi:hypothetical protein
MGDDAETGQTVNNVFVYRTQQLDHNTDTLRYPRPRDHGFYGPRAGRKTHEPEGGGGVMT